tara:strand:- start:59 stop:226 length:168 start_codon:yes stop_codon:yes gene_type:complete
MAKFIKDKKPKGEALAASAVSPKFTQLSRREEGSSQEDSAISKRIEGILKNVFGG